MPAPRKRPCSICRQCGQPDRYLVIDGYKRIAALQQLGRDIVEAVVWPMSEAEALLLDRSMRLSEQESALEQGWLLAELISPSASSVWMKSLVPGLGQFNRALLGNFWRAPKPVTSHRQAFIRQGDSQSI